MRQEWTACTLGDVLTLQRGFDLPSRERRDGAVPIVSSSGITGYHNTAKVKWPGVITGRYGTLGEVFYIEQDYWPLNTTLYVRDFKGNHPRFVSYFLRTLDLASQDAAGAVPGVNRNHLHMMAVRVPPLSIQRKIAAVLSTYDSLIENNARRIAILEEMAQALYREWFVHFRFPGREEVPMVESALGLVPEGWEVQPLTAAVMVDPATKIPKEGDKPFVPMGSLSSNSMIIRDVESRTGNSGSKFRNSDTLFARITPCIENGKTGFVQFLPTETAAAFGSTEFIVLRSRTLRPEYVYLLARSSELRDTAIKSMTGATGRQRVQPAAFGSFLFAHPDATTLARFEVFVRPVFQQVHVLALKNDNLRSTRDLLLPKLISGELYVEELDIATMEADV